METGLDLYRSLVDEHQEKVLFFQAELVIIRENQLLMPELKS